MSAEASSRTLVLSVVAVDLVGYSRKSIAEQLSLKDHFNQLLLTAIIDIPIADRIILDTGDGVAMGFLGDPEDALYVAMFMHAAVNRDSAGGLPAGVDGSGSGNAIRIGINLGPVKLATGVGGHPNIIGDGVNVAERIMGFAEPGQLTASRPFFQVMSKMSDHYTTLFEYAGERTDQQVRTHDVYLMGKSVLAFQQAARGVAERAAQRAGKSAIPPVSPVNASAASQPPAKVAETPTVAPADAPVERHPALIDFLEDRRKVATTATLLAVAAVTLASLLVYRKMLTIAPDGSAPAVVALSPLPESRDSSASASNATGTVDTVKAPVKSPPLTAPAVTPPPSVTKSTAASPPVVTPATTTVPPKGSERPPLPTAAIPIVVRHKPKDAMVEKTERGDRPDKASVRDEIRNDPRKVVPPRPAGDREKTAPVPNAPFIPNYQSPTEALRPESVVPTPSLPMPAAPRPDTSVVIVSRSDPSYPVEGIRQGILKLVVVKARLSIDAAGNVTEVGILEGGPIGAFGRETRATLKQWKFNPGAPSRTKDVEITFKP